MPVDLAELHFLTYGVLHPQCHRRRPLPVAAMREIYAYGLATLDTIVKLLKPHELHSLLNLLVRYMSELYGLKKIIGEIAVKLPHDVTQLLF